MKKNIFLLCALLIISSYAFTSPLQVKSPNGKVIISVNTGNKTSFSVEAFGKTLIRECVIGMQLSDIDFGESSKLTEKKEKSIKEVITPTVPLKFSTVVNECNELTLNFKGGFSLQFRAYDDGAAYRFVVNRKGEIEVLDEVMEITFGGDCLAHLQQSPGFITSCEENYTHVNISEWKKEERFSSLPMLVDNRDGNKILISESDLRDYPGLFLQGNSGVVKAVFPKCPIEFGYNGDRSVKIVKEADYIAKTLGKRTFPWRYFFVTDDDAKLLECTMTLRLAEPNKLKDTSWIKPGQVSWEWWNGAAPYGPDVNFETGCNLQTYKYFVDFASKYGIPYIIMDEGWAKTTTNPYEPNPAIDLFELISYAKSKNVKIILWLTWLATENNFDLFKTFREWGIAGVKIDFMDRSDQWMVNFYERVVKEAAANELLIDFHGSYKPSGLEITYPNLLSYEGVRGMEQMGGCTPKNSLYLPFIRNAVGAMDYTPGAMTSMQPESYASRRPNSASIGTRAYQLALFVVFESGIQMLSDSPTQYYNNPTCTDFISSVPVIWDETKAIEGEVGKYVAVAKRKGDKWFIAAITAEQGRELNLPLSFLPEGKTFDMHYFADGPNSHQQAMDYRQGITQVTPKSVIPIKLSRNGGFVASFEVKK